MQSESLNLTRLMLAERDASQLVWFARVTREWVAAWTFIGWYTICLLVGFAAGNVIVSQPLLIGALVIAPFFFARDRFKFEMLPRKTVRLRALVSKVATRREATHLTCTEWDGQTLIAIGPNGQLVGKVVSDYGSMPVNAELTHAKCYEVYLSTEIADVDAEWVAVYLIKLTIQARAPEIVGEG